MYAFLPQQLVKWLGVGSLLLALISGNSLYAQCEDNGTVWEESWVSCQLTPNPNPALGPSHWILFEFDEPQSIDSIHIWNANRTGELAWGIKTARIDYAEDSSNWENLGMYTFPQGPGTLAYEGFDGPNLGGVFVKKILLTVLETYGNGSCASLAEIQFNIDPDACYGTIDACGVCDGEGESVWYIDEDNDGLGSPYVVIAACEQPDGYVDNADDECDNGLVGWNQISTLFQENGCMGCHGVGGAGGLNLSTFESAKMGGDNCGSQLFVGTTLADIIMVDNYQGCNRPVAFPSMNERVGGQIDSAELALIKQWVAGGAPKECDCIPGAVDADNDGVCDQADACPDFDNSLIGTPCDDGSVCTYDDKWTSSCQCEGTPQADSDQDGICDAEDAEPDNPCTADGIIDGQEPMGWVPQPANDCDQDGVTIAGGDLNDLEACIDEFGSKNTTECTCESDAETRGGTVVYSMGVNNANRADGLPDGTFSNGMYGSDTLQIQLPYLSKGEQVCVSTRFSDDEGRLRVDVNGNLYTFLNTEPGLDQIKCLTTLAAGEQLLTITESGSGGIFIDGTSFSHCPCSDSASLIENAASLIGRAYTSQQGWQYLEENLIEVCEGDSLRLGMGPYEDFSYTWSGPYMRNTPTSELVLGIVSPQMEGLYTAAYQNEHGCVIRKDIWVIVKPAPQVQFVKRDPICAEDKGGVITFSFPDDPQYTGLEFSITGESGPYTATSDQIGSFSMTELPPETYDLWARWNDNECPVNLGLLTLSCENVPLFIEEGQYLITAKASGYVLDSEGWEPMDSSNVIQWPMDSLRHQGWQLDSLGIQRYSIRMALNGGALSGEEEVLNTQANVSQQIWGERESQKWELEDAGDDWYYIRNRGNNLFLTVEGGSTREQVNIRVEAFEGSDAQKFRFTPYMPDSVYPDGPVFVDAKAIWVYGNAQVDWTVRNHIPISYFRVDRSPDAEAFSPVTQIPVEEDTAYFQAYQILDEAPVAGPVYYQITAVAADSQEYASEIVLLQLDTKLLLFPNPIVSGQTLQAQVLLPTESDFSISITDMGGRVVATYEAEIQGGIGTIEISLPPKLAKGLYYFNLRGEEENIGSLFEYR